MENRIVASGISNNYEGAVLIADDEEDARELLAELLTLRGFSVQTVANGAEGMALLRSGQRVRFVLTDLQMPVLDGLGFLSALSADPRLRDVPVCVSTSMPSLVPSGVACLPKPINLPKLYAMLKAGSKRILPT